MLSCDYNYENDNEVYLESISRGLRKYRTWESWKVLATCYVILLEDAPVRWSTLDAKRSRGAEACSTGLKQSGLRFVSLPLNPLPSHNVLWHWLVSRNAWVRRKIQALVLTTRSGSCQANALLPPYVTSTPHWIFVTLLSLDAV